MQIRNSYNKMKLKLTIFFLPMFTAGFAQTDTSHHVPADKHLPAGWKQGLYADGAKTWTGNELTTIGMPCGGIAAGQLYVRGDGTLACWWICNNASGTGQGAVSYWNFQTPLGPWKTGYQTYTPVSYIDQGFAITVKTGKSVFKRPLDKSGFDAISFKGEYPVATVSYKNKRLPLPVNISMQLFSPFIPLDAKESATPGTILQFTLKNTSTLPQTITLTGHLQNLVGLYLKDTIKGTNRNRVIRKDGMTSVFMDLVNTTLPVAHPYNGNLCLSVLSGTATAIPAEKPLGQPLVGAIGSTIRLQPGESRTITFLLTWYFPNRPAPDNNGDWNSVLDANSPVIGNNYANWFGSSLEVAQWLKGNLPRLEKQTFGFVDAYYHQATLPYWLKRRIMMPVSNLATETTQWWSNGKFFAWEGVGSCMGTCTHVWTYAQGMAHLFPELERNVREQTDFSTSFNPDGSIAMRNGGGGWAIDGQAGTVLKAYREHLMSSNDLFLSRNWEKIKKAEQYLIKSDGNGDGKIEGAQPNTYDIYFYGANTFIGSLYLASLKASAKMAMLMRDSAFAKTCDSISANGTKNTVTRLWNGHYFRQETDPEHKDNQYGNGCLSDQLFGQTWAGLNDLGNLYPQDNIKTALNAIYTYNWAPDVAAQTRAHPPERPFADPGEAGLFICTWPFNPHPSNGMRYDDEVWTGIEYEVATDMICQGLTGEGLSLVKGLDQRYSPQKHNPYNEFECGDHYARALASFGLLPALEGYTYDGPAQSIGFDPKLNTDHFSGFFTAAEGWGDMTQRRNKGGQVNSIHLVYGKLSLKTMKFSVRAKPKKLLVKIGQKSVPVQWQYNRDQVIINTETLTLCQKETLIVDIQN